ncbi:MAG: ABC transporter permease [Bacteroidota bacterium]|nr:ABC transporter permease [Bacteroidota bacterium]MDP4204801.1 ABC transporter permease [Bacteroidota bacterium]
MMIKRIKDGFTLTANCFTQELKAIFKDSGALLLFVIAILSYPVIYSIGYEKELVRDIPVAVVDMDKTASSRLLARMADATEQINVKDKPSSLQEAKDLFYKGEVNGVLLIPKDFEKDLYHGHQTAVSVYCDASYFLLYKQVLTAGVMSSSYFSAGVEMKKLMGQKKSYEQALSARDPLAFKAYYLYNPSSAYGSFVMPGMILVILQQTLLIGIGMLGGTTREKKRYKFMVPSSSKSQKVMPLVLGHSLAYILIYLFNTVFGLLWVYDWFSFPDKSGFFKILFLMIPFIMAVTFLGMTMSVLFKRREHSLMFMVFLSPAILFVSGLSWPSSAIPPLIHHLSYVFPTTAAIPAYLRLRTMGVDLSAISNELWFLMGQTVVYFLCACAAYKLAMKQAFKKIDAEEDSID